MKSAQDSGANGDKAVETIDNKLARAGRLFLSAHDSDQIDGDILLSEARETVAALVEALKGVLVGTTADCGKIRHPSEQAVIAAFAALRAAGVATSGGLGELL